MKIKCFLHLRIPKWSEPEYQVHPFSMESESDEYLQYILLKTFYLDIGEIDELAREVEPLSQHAKWLQKQVEFAVAKANAGEGKFTSNDEVKRVMNSRKDEIRAKYKR